MELRLPQHVLQWLDSVRGEKSRQAFIVALLAQCAEAKLYVKE